MAQALLLVLVAVGVQAAFLPAGAQESFVLPTYYAPSYPPSYAVPTYPPSSAPPSYPPPSPQPPSPPPPLALSSLSASVRYSGYAAECTASIISGNYPTITATTSTTGDFAINTFGEGEVEVATSSVCKDSFTGLAIPFPLSAIAPNEGSITMSPVITLTRYNVPTVADAYAMVQAYYSNGDIFTLVKSSNVAMKASGFSMYTADNKMATLVLLASKYLRNLAGSGCPSDADRADAVYAAMASIHSSTTPFNFDSKDHIKGVISAAATMCSRTTVAASLDALADALKAVSSEYNKVSIRFVLSPIPSFISTARITYVTHTRLAEIVDTNTFPIEASPLLLALSTQYESLIDTAPVQTAALITALGLSALEPTVELTATVKSAGVLGSCAVTYDNLYLFNQMSATTNADGKATISGASHGLLTTATGCTDSLLSTPSKTITNSFQLAAAIPHPGKGTAVFSPMGTLATVYWIANSISGAPRYMTNDDYKVVYNYFGIQGDYDYVSQDWDANSATQGLVFTTEQQLNGFVTVGVKFIAVSQGKSRTAGISQGLLFKLVADMAANKASVTGAASIQAYMAAAFKEAAAGQVFSLDGSDTPSTTSSSGRRLLQSTLSDADLANLAGKISTVVADSNGIIQDLKNQIQAALASGSSIDISKMINEAAKVAQVQQSSISDLVGQIAAAVAAGDLARANSVASDLVASYSGDALRAAVAEAVINSAPVSSPPPPPQEESKSSTKNTVVIAAAAAAGGGVALLGVVGYLIYRRRKAHANAVHPESSSSAAAGQPSKGSAAIAEGVEGQQRQQRHSAVLVGPAVPQASTAWTDGASSQDMRQKYFKEKLSRVLPV